MNRYFLPTFLCLLFLAPCTQAANVYVPYIGVDGIYNIAKAKQVKPQYYGADINLGTTYNQYFGTEIFYAQTGSDAKKISEDEKLKTSYRAYGLDLVGYLPVVSGFKLTATAGVATYVFKEKTTGQKHSDDEGYGYRFGAGFMYDLNKNISLRALARYINFDHISDVDHTAEYVLGLRYYFLKD